ncbi:MAG TPA: methyltransferase [Allosphingosinicella sp.]|uniref:class I SAM-dependent methyltransferase n=1 Tax=Allosphingosinicella sp. TaxID=2823234 RepID=UPI002EDB5D99
MRGIKTSLLALLITVSPAQAVAAPADVAAAVAGADRPKEDVALDASRKPAEVLKFLGLEKDDRVFDWLSGNGYYSEIMARAVGPKGAVIAWNPAGFLGEETTKRWAALRSRAPNASLMRTGAVTLAPESLDFTMLHMVYHDAYWESEKFKFPRMDPNALLRDLYVATKPGGIVGVVDHVAAPGGDTREVVEKLHRIDPATIKADFERAGFVLEAESDLLRMSGDDHSKNVFDPEIRGKTDRVVYRFRKPA